MYESTSGEISISSSGNQVMSFNNTLITALRNLLCQGTTCTSLSNSGTSNLAAVNCGNITSTGLISNGPNLLSTGSISCTQIQSTGNWRTTGNCLIGSAASNAFNQLDVYGNLGISSNTSRYGYSYNKDIGKMDMLDIHN